MSKTEKRKEKILELIAELFGDTSEDRNNQLEALGEISSTCEMNMSCLEDDLAGDE